MPKTQETQAALRFRLDNPEIIVLHGYRLALTYDLSERLPKYPSLTLFKRLLKTETLALISLRRHLLHDAHPSGLGSLGGGRLDMLTTCSKMLELHRVGLWSWGRFAVKSLKALQHWVLERTWLLAMDPIPRKRPLPPPEDWNPQPAYPHDPNFKPAPEDDYLDYGSFIPRRTRGPH